MISILRAPVFLCGLALAANATAASVTLISGGGQTARSGTFYAQPVVLLVRDASGAPLSGAYTQLMKGTFGDSRLAFNPFSNGQVTDSQGLVSFDSMIAQGDAGTLSISANVLVAPGVGQVFPDLFEMHITGLQPARMDILSGGDQSAPVNELFASPLVARVTNELGAPVPNAVVRFDLQHNSDFIPPPGTPTATFVSGDVSTVGMIALVVADDHGIAVSPGFRANEGAGAWTMVASAFYSPWRPDGPRASTPMRNLAVLDGMWWGGLGENGWGLSIAQGSNNLFTGFYVYDASGNPVWHVLPVGSWNSARTVFSGLLYTPTGSPFFAYDASRLQVGAPVGVATFTFTGRDTAELELTVDGVTTRKSISRQVFGAGVRTGPGVGGMWWGGAAQNGWGLSIDQQGSELFSVWYTYDASGRGVWYVLPGGDWTSPTSYEGRIYKTSGSLLAAYDPARLRVIDVGGYRLRFEGNAATLEYSVEGRSGTLSLTRQPL